MYSWIDDSMGADSVGQGPEAHPPMPVTRARRGGILVVNGSVGWDDGTIGGAAVWT